MTWTLTSLSIKGIKGVLDRAGEFRLPPKGGRPRSIAIFGRNGFGKSGYADAIEYLFSFDGEVGHLGKGGADSEQGGKHAIPHVLAVEKGITPEISAEFSQIESDRRVSATRPVVTGRNDPRPDEIGLVLQHSPAHRILRQHDLRRFVVDMAPGEKFSEFARWIGLENTAKLLSHLTTTENTLRDTDVDREISERIQSIESHTSGKFITYDPNSIYQWCDDAIRKHIDQLKPIYSISDLEEAIRLLRKRRESLLLESQAAQAHVARDQLLSTLQALMSERGQLHLIDTLLPSVLASEQSEIAAKSKASQSIFQEVWTSAKRVIDEQKPGNCPICKTPWVNTEVGSIDKVII